MTAGVVILSLVFVGCLGLAYLNERDLAKRKLGGKSCTRATLHEWC